MEKKDGSSCSDQINKVQIYKIKVLWTYKERIILTIPLFFYPVYHMRYILVF